ncbi:MAG TPA: APC family permease [Candidatus Acidoferrum sp.]|nr:APC family permease [Candidatus Acidoferrum sp.]
MGYDVTARRDVDLLHPKAVGLIGVLFLTVTGSAPISAMLFNTPIAVGYGEGIGTPAAFMVATIVLLIFSVGYCAMARKVTAVGGFYSFISHGLGREAGMAMGFASVVAYSVFEASLCGGFAYFMNLKILELTGANVPWPYFALFMVALIAILTFFDVKLSAWILGIALIGEVVILLIFDLGVFTSSAANLDGAGINPINAFKDFEAHNDLAAGAWVIGLFFAFWSWVGFEMAPNYGEESRDPKRIVPLSMYISVLGLGIFYTITSWAGISAYPTIDDAIKISQTDAAHFFLTPAASMVGGWVSQLMSYLILTGAFACGMAFHNTAARYFYSLGREGVFPRSLGKTHLVYKSPYVASFTQSVIAAILVVAYWISDGGNDPFAQAYLGVYSLYAVVGTMLIMLAQALVSVAIIVYFRTHHREEHHWWTTFVAPLIAFFAQLAIIGVMIWKMDFLGSGYRFADYIVWINLAVLAIGVVGALYLRRADPEKYDKIGRLIYQGVPEGK